MIPTGVVITMSEEKVDKTRRGGMTTFSFDDFPRNSALSKTEYIVYL